MVHVPSSTQGTTGPGQHPVTGASLTRFNTYAVQSYRIAEKQQKYQRTSKHVGVGGALRHNWCLPPET